MNQDLDSETLDNSFAQVDLPKAGTALTCGIIALPFSLGIIGIILSIVAITNANSCIRMYVGSPGKYTEKSLKRAKAGKTCGIISLSLFGASMLVVILVLAIGNGF